MKPKDYHTPAPPLRAAQTLATTNTAAPQRNKRENKTPTHPGRLGITTDNQSLTRYGFPHTEWIVFLSSVALALLDLPARVIARGTRSACR